MTTGSSLLEVLKFKTDSTAGRKRLCPVEKRFCIAHNSIITLSACEFAEFPVVWLLRTLKLALKTHRRQAIDFSGTILIIRMSNGIDIKDNNNKSPTLVHRKVAVLGYKGIGKTSLVNSFVTGSFTEQYEPTIETVTTKTIRFRKVKACSLASQKNWKVPSHSYLCVDVGSFRNGHCRHGGNGRIFSFTECIVGRAWICHGLFDCLQAILSHNSKSQRCVAVLAGEFTWRSTSLGRDDEGSKW